jgi:hypothetical protein
MISSDRSDHINRGGTDARGKQRFLPGANLPLEKIRKKKLSPYIPRYLFKWLKTVAIAVGLDHCLLALPALLAIATVFSHLKR